MFGDLYPLLPKVSTTTPEGCNTTLEANFLQCFDTFLRCSSNEMREMCYASITEGNVSSCLSHQFLSEIHKSFCLEDHRFLPDVAQITRCAGVPIRVSPVLKLNWIGVAWWHNDRPPVHRSSIDGLNRHFLPTLRILCGCGRGDSFVC